MFFARGALLFALILLSCSPCFAAKGPVWSGAQIVEVDGEKIAIRRLDLPGDVSFVFQDKAIGAAQTELWISLSGQGQTEFIARRKKVLERLAKVLTSTELGWGIGKLGKDFAVSMLTRNRLNDNPVERFVAQASKEGVIQAADLSVLRQRSRRTVQDLLSLLDRELWSHPKLVSESNEVGMTLIADVGLGALVGRKGFYGAAGFGITFAYNHQAEGVVFEIFHDLERGTRGLPVVAQGAVCFKCFAHVGSQDAKNPVLTQSGRSVYPPGPMGVLDTPRFLETGLSHGFGLPPFDSVYAMEGRFHRGTWMRFATSRVEGSTQLLVHSMLSPSRTAYLASLGRGVKGCLNFVADMFRQ